MLALYKQRNQLLWNQHFIEMNNLDFILLNILEQFNDFYCNVALIEWAIKTDTLASLIEPDLFFCYVASSWHMAECSSVIASK